MRVFVTGGTGFIGKGLVVRWLSEGHDVVVASRTPRTSTDTHLRYVAWDGHTVGEWAKEVDGADAVVHLAGEGILDRRWTDEVKRDLIASRVESTRAVVSAIEKAAKKPSVLLSGSAVGYYGDAGDRVVDESSPPGTDFLAELCVRWEAETARAASLGTRVVTLRTGIVLGKNGGALEQMATPFKAFVGGPIGTGKQWFPWIHLADVHGIIAMALAREDWSGPFNLVAPNPVRMGELAQGIGHALHRPSFFKLPSFAARLMLGERAEALLGGQRVSAEKAIRAGYEFRFSEVSAALADLL